MKTSHLVAGFVIALFGLVAPRPVSAQTPAPAPATSGNATVSVHITAFRNTKGVARVSLFSTDKGFPDKNAAQSQVVDLSKSLTGDARDITVTFLNLAPGTYAVSVLHDENNNKKMDSHWYGKPKEGVATSNNPRPKMRTPRWNEAKFDVPASGKTVEIAVWYP